jgi:HAD superfamily hydrolase (TIGR01509 family)
MLEPLPKLILFDADGTLYESEHLNFQANQATARELHNFDLTWDEFDREVRRGPMTSPELLQSHGHQVDHERYIELRHNYYRDIATDQLKPVPGIVDFLLWCESNDIRRIIVSSSRRRLLMTSIEILGIDSFFEAIIAHEDVGNRRKPDPYPYVAGLELCDVSADEALVFEDTRKGITAARGAGLRCIGIRNATNSDAELSQAERVIHDYRELFDK